MRWDDIVCFEKGEVETEAHYQEGLALGAGHCPEGVCCERLSHVGRFGGSGCCQNGMRFEWAVRCHDDGRF